MPSCFPTHPEWPARVSLAPAAMECPYICRHCSNDPRAGYWCFPLPPPLRGHLNILCRLEGRGHREGDHYNTAIIKERKPTTCNCNMEVTMRPVSLLFRLYCF